jgi:hypothetical protein
MRIRQLVRNAVFIAVAAIVTAGFSVGIAQATSAAPASTVPVSSAVHSVRPPMPVECSTGDIFCSLGLAGHTLYIIQSFGCQTGVTHTAVSGTIYEMLNYCPYRVLYYNPGEKCINPDTGQAGEGRFGTVTKYYTSPVMSC